MSEYTKEFIKEKLGTDRRWIEHAILMIFKKNQTTTEQAVGNTTIHNNIGFTGVDGRYLSYCAKWLDKPGNHLNDKHFEKCKKKLPKYWKQIQTMIKEKNLEDSK